MSDVTNVRWWMPFSSCNTSPPSPVSDKLRGVAYLQDVPDASPERNISPYSPEECVEGGFCELRLDRVLGSWRSPARMPRGVLAYNSRQRLLGGSWDRDNRSTGMALEGSLAFWHNQYMSEYLSGFFGICMRWPMSAEAHDRKNNDAREYIPDSPGVIALPALI